MNSIRTIMGWRMKMAAKLVLSRLPLGYGFWQKANLFRHGAMDSPEYALEVFSGHLKQAGFPGRKKPFTVLELGPGDALFTALAARVFGAGKIYLVDTGPWARTDLSPYREMARYLKQKGLPAPDPGWGTFDDLLESCSACYLTRGLESLKQIPDQSVDLVFSHAVLEHVRKADLMPTFGQLNRITSPGGANSHRVDLRDHLGGALNHLRFSDKFWESGLVAESGFYTNRVRMGSMLGMMKQAGFLVEKIRAERWQKPPLAAGRMDRPFQNLGQDDLSVKWFDVLLQPSHGIEKR